MDGVRNGFRITSTEYTGPNIWQKNYKSATGPDTREAVEKQIVEELRNGRYMFANHRPRIISALGAIPKNADGTKVRLIHDCSRPTGSALNDLACVDKFSYQSVQDAVKLITPGCYMVKVDLSSAFRSVRLHRSDYQNAGLAWAWKDSAQEDILIDTRLPFGAKRSPFIFNALSQAVCGIYKKGGHHGITAYLDDFLLISPDFQSALEHRQQLMSLLRRLGFAINYSKINGPSKIITFLGIELNSLTGTLGLPLDKLRSFMADVKRVYSSKTASKRDLQSLLGRLAWMGQVIWAGKCHMQRIVDRITALKHPAHRSSITREMRMDLAWWINYAAHFNGTVPMLDQRPYAPVCVDACNRGGGGYFGSEFFNIQWSQWPGSEDLHINYKEVLALEPAVHLWAHKWRNKIIKVHSDNKTAVSILKKGHCKNPLVMNSLRRILWLSAIYNFKLSPVWYSGSQNFLADACSRIHEPSAQQLLYDYFIAGQWNFRWMN